MEHVSKFDERLKRKDECKHCGKELIEGVNHSDYSYESDICDDCMDKFYGYCDKCDELFEYWEGMRDTDVIGVVCPECYKKIKTKTIDLPIAYVNFIDDCLRMIKEHELVRLLSTDNGDWPAIASHIDEVMDKFCKPLEEIDEDVQIIVGGNEQ